MNNSTTAAPTSATVRLFIGLDVHKDTISGAVIPAFGPDIAERFQIPNTPDAVAKIAARLSARGSFSFVFEAGPTGYGLQRQLSSLGHACAVVSPALTPRLLDLAEQEPYKARVKYLRVFRWPGARSVGAVGLVRRALNGSIESGYR